MSQSDRKKDCNALGITSPGIVPEGTPEWITSELIEHTIRVWQPFYTEMVTPEEAVSMIMNVGRLYDLFSSRPVP